VKLACQIILAAIYLFGFFRMLKSDFEPTPAKPAGGYKGAVASIIAISFSISLSYFAGAFSELTGGVK